MLQGKGLPVKRLLIGILLFLAVACGPPFEEGQVTGTTFHPGHEEARSRAIYYPCPTYGFDGKMTTGSCFAGYDHYTVWIPDAWTVDVLGTTDDGDQVTEHPRINAPADRPPALEGDTFSLVEMRVVAEP